MSELIGKTVGQYQIVEQIGEGGMATIFKAYQPSIDRYVAVKILPSQLAEDENFVKRFEHEAKAIAALEHPHILPVHDFGTEGKLTYMVMRYVKGGTLSNLMGKPMAYERIVEIVSDVARALDYAHERGVVHRDIKPSNILIDAHGEVLLTDFGIAKMVEGSASTQLTAAGSILGTPAYMAPEQAQGQKVDGRSDIYSLGVVLYELLTGRPPYQAETPFAIVLKHINDPLPPPRAVNANIPEPLERVVLKAMSKDANQRFETAGEMAQTLQNALKEIDGDPAMMTDPAAAAPQPHTLREPKSQPTLGEAPKKSSMTPLLLVGAVGLALLCVLGGGGLVLWGLADSGQDENVVVDTPAAVAIDTPTAVAAGSNTGDTQPQPTAENSQVEVANNADAGSEAVNESSEAEILFKDDFNTNQNGWLTGEDSDEFGRIETEIEAGLYSVSLTSTSEDGNFLWLEPFGIDEFDNFNYSVLVPQVSHQGAFSYGLIFRSNPNGDFYMFEIDDEGFYMWLALADDDWQELIPYTETSVINPGGPNELMVEAVGPSLTFFINGEEVAAIGDDTLDSGSIGLVVETFEEGGNVDLEFDTLVVTEAGSPAPAEAPDGDIIFADYFDSDANGWATGQFEDEFSQHEVTIAGGKYTLSAATQPEQTPYIEKTLPNQEFSDFVLSVEATPHDTAEHYSYGIAFRENAAGHTYAFEAGNDGLYGIFLFDGEWTTLKDWSSTKAINVGETNELMVVADGEVLSFFINGQELTTLEDDTLPEGEIGLLVEFFEEDSSAAVDFDNLVVKSIED